jgi:hypothetical protein
MIANEEKVLPIDHFGGTAVNSPWHRSLACLEKH